MNLGLWQPIQTMNFFLLSTILRPTTSVLASFPPLYISDLNSMDSTWMALGLMSDTCFSESSPTFATGRLGSEGLLKT